MNNMARSTSTYGVRQLEKTLSLLSIFFLSTIMAQTTKRLHKKQNTPSLLYTYPLSKVRIAIIKTQIKNTFFHSPHTKKQNILP